MTITAALLGFGLTALLMTLTPGMDTALVLRTAVVEGGYKAMLAGSGIVAGVMIWGLATAAGLGAVLSVSPLAYAVIQLTGAGYLLWLGAKLLSKALKPSGGFVPAQLPDDRDPRWFVRGLLTNLLNPKIGVFYVSLLPQFIPEHVPAIAFGALLAGIHAALGLLWFATLVLATRPLARWLRTPALTRSLDAMTGLALLGFGLRVLLHAAP
jgi:Putative threonine efflux protein